MERPQGTIFHRNAWIFGFLALAIVAGLLFSFRESPSLSFSIPARINQADILLAPATSDAERTRGLSGWPHLEDGTGLYMRFEAPGFHGIWMKEMLFALDILWIDEEGTIIWIKENFKPSSYPEIAFPNASTSGVLELPAGFVKKEKIKIGDRVIFP